MISHKHKVIFVHIPKCGGQSIENLFLDDLGLNWPSRMPLLLSQNRASRVGPPVLSHLLASEYVRFNYISQEIFESYFKFAYVRDPFARVISTFNYKEKIPRLRKRQENYPHSLEQFVMQWLPKVFERKSTYETYPHKYLGNYYFMRPQVDFIYDDNGNSLVDKVFRLEQIKENHKEVLKLLHNGTELRHVNAPEQKLCTVEDLTGDMKDVIVDLYRDDFERLEYEQ